MRYFQKNTKKLLSKIYFNKNFFKVFLIYKKLEFKFNK